MTNDGLVPEKRKGFYEDYIGKWIIVYPIGIHNNFAGKVIDVKEGYARLKPFQTSGVIEGRLVRILSEEEPGASAPLEGSGIEPVTEAYLVAWIEMMNKQDVADGRGKRRKKD